MPKIYIVERIFSKHHDWPAVNKIAQTLLARGHAAVVGGRVCARCPPGVEAKDLDIATDATPDQVESYFERVLPLGKSFGVCRVIEGKASIEVATFREEFDYQDGRRPQRVEFSSMEEDAKRRDFTINAIFYDLKTQALVDLVGGKEDLRLGRLRAVGVAAERFTEDYLRILRGVRFAGQLGFELERETKSAMANLREGLHKISRERIYDELNKMFLSGRASACWQLLVGLRIDAMILPDWEVIKPPFDLRTVTGDRSAS